MSGRAGGEGKVADAVSAQGSPPSATSDVAGPTPPRASGPSPLGVYVHVPFCARACPYCDFDFEVGRLPGLEARVSAWWEGIQAELRARGAPAGGRNVDTLYFGGGTPSALGPHALVEVLTTLRAELNVSADAEITVEVNPEHVDTAMVDALQRGGATRVSVGLQSTDPEALATLGRAHDAVTGMAAVEALVLGGFDVSVDLIVGWPGQTVAALELDVTRMASLGARHVSVYALTIEPDVPWMRLVRRGRRALPDADEQGTLLEIVEERLLALGFQHYEVASYGAGSAACDGEHSTTCLRAPTVEARHNRKYWTWQDVFALGPSASSVWHDPLTGSVRRETNPRGIDAWRAATVGGGDVPGVELLSPEHAAKEGLWLGLRRLTGFQLGEFLTSFRGVDRAWVEARLAQLRARGLVSWGEDDWIALTRRAWLHHDAVGAHVLR